MAAWTDEQIERLKVAVGYDPNNPVCLAYRALGAAMQRKREAYREFEAALLAVEQAKADLEFEKMKRGKMN